VNGAKHTQKKSSIRQRGQTEPGLIAFYGIWPENGLYCTTTLIEVSINRSPNSCKIHRLVFIGGGSYWAGRAAHFFAFVGRSYAWPAHF